MISIGDSPHEREALMRVTLGNIPTRRTANSWCVRGRKKARARVIDYVLLDQDEICQVSVEAGLDAAGE